MTNHIQIEREAADWLARRQAEDWSSAEDVAFNTWLDGSVAHRVAFLRLEETWAQAERLKALAAGLSTQEIPERGRWQMLSYDGKHSVSPSPLPDLRGITLAPRATANLSSGWKYRAMAATSLLAIGLASFIGWQASGQHHASHTSGIGQIQTVTLPDGSQATLSSDSQIDVRISRQKRNVTLLRGEVIFDVASDPRRAFVVHSNQRRITAIGTHFSVRHKDQAVRVVVTEGLVRLESSKGSLSAPVTLLPAGSIALANDQGVQVATVTPSDAERLLEWRSGYLSFDDTSLADAVAEFNRFTIRKLELADTEIGVIRIGGNFRWSNAEGFVHLLEQAFPIRAEHTAQRIVLHAR